MRVGARSRDVPSGGPGQCAQGIRFRHRIRRCPHRSRRGHRFPKAGLGPTAVAGGVVQTRVMSTLERADGFLFRRETGVGGQIGHGGHLRHTIAGKPAGGKCMNHRRRWHLRSSCRAAGSVHPVQLAPKPAQTPHSSITPQEPSSWTASGCSCTRGISAAVGTAGRFNGAQLP